VNVIWDLAIHDLSIMDYVLPAKAIAVSATGISHIVPGHVAISGFRQTRLPFSSNWLMPVAETAIALRAARNP